jgi:hypothetical protein
LPFAADRWRDRTKSTPDRIAPTWAEFLGRIPWEWFVTLTFDPNRLPSVSCDYASREAFWWCGLVGHVYRKPIGWVYAVERQRNGRHHAHALLVGLPPETRWSVTRNVWSERNGTAIKIQPLATMGRVALYTSKAVARDGEIALADTLQRYRRNLAADVVVGLIGSS